jgi:hypothetical protein
MKIKKAFTQSRKAFAKEKTLRILCVSASLRALFFEKAQNGKFFH